MEDLETCDDQPDLATYRRAHWEIVSLRTCLRHRMPLVDLDIAPQPAVTHDFAALIDGQADRIHELTDRDPEPLTSDFEAYLDNRLDRRKQDLPWLDARGFSAAAKFCEMLGAVALFGRTLKLNSLTSANWAKAAAIGFDIARGGAEAIRSFLDSLQVSSDGAGNAGPQQIFGRLYQWLEFEATDPHL